MKEVINMATPYQNIAKDALIYMEELLSKKMKIDSSKALELLYNELINGRIILPDYSFFIDTNPY